MVSRRDLAKIEDQNSLRNPPHSILYLAYKAYSLVRPSRFDKIPDQKAETAAQP
jgi:hypothetical protein